MPYKNPDDKRRWEQEHREQRNARRRQKHSEIQSPTASPTPDPIPAKEAIKGWKILATVVAGIAMVLLSALAGTKSD